MNQETKTRYLSFSRRHIKRELKYLKADLKDAIQIVKTHRENIRFLKKRLIK